MSSLRLKSQFDTLFDHYGGHDVSIQIDDITQLFSCTRRNARMVLNKLHELGWITWSPSPGRGKLSELRFLQTMDGVKLELAKHWVTEGKVGRAYTILEQDIERLALVMRSFLGFHRQNEMSILRLPYYRELNLLAPVHTLSRAEKNITNQIFSGLTRLDEQGRVVGDIAHHWQAVSDTQWHFYLRPHIRCHNGKLLMVEQIITALEQLTALPLFSHMQAISSPAAHILEIQLSAPDQQLPRSLSESCAKIRLESDEPSLDMVGTGPFKLITSDQENGLVLEAFDDYFGYRPLMDRIEIYPFIGEFAQPLYSTLSMSEQHNMLFTDMALDLHGCYLVLNRNSDIGLSKQWGNYLGIKLASLAVFSHLEHSSIVNLGLMPAFGLLHGVNHVDSASATPSLPVRVEPIVIEPIAIEPIVIGVELQHPVLLHTANIIQHLLEEDGYKVTLLNAKDMAPSEVDMWLGNFCGTGTSQEASILDLLSNPYLICSLDVTMLENINLIIQQWRQTKEPGLAVDISRLLIESNTVIPLLHSTGLMIDIKDNSDGLYGLGNANFCNVSEHL